MTQFAGIGSGAVKPSPFPQKSPLHGYVARPITAQLPASSIASPAAKSFVPFTPVDSQMPQTSAGPAPLHVPHDSKIHTTGQGRFTTSKNAHSFTIVTQPKPVEPVGDDAHYRSYVARKQGYEKPVERRLYQQKKGCCGGLNACFCGCFDRLACCGCLNCGGCCDRPAMVPNVDYNIKKKRRCC